MLILIATLFVDLAVLVDSSGSPERLPHQVHYASGPASTSGRKFEDVSPSNRYMEEENVSSVICHYDKDGIFYEENGHFYPVKHGIPLIECRGYIIGRASNGLVHPIFNSEHDRVLTERNNFHQQCFITDRKSRDKYESSPITSQCRIVNIPVPNTPEVKAESSTSHKKFKGKQ